MRNKIPIIFSGIVLLMLIGFITLLFSIANEKANASENLITDVEELSNNNIELIESKNINNSNLSYMNTTSSLDKFNQEPTIQKKFHSMREKYNNKDIIGHLKINDTTINYPIFQSSDNDYYLNKDSAGNYDVAGSIYLDFENDISTNDKNTIIYGHNMNKNYMFHSLRYYADKDYYDKHKYITFDTLYENQTWEIFSYYKTDTSFYYIKTFFSDDNDFKKMLDTMKSKSLYDTNVEVTPNDRILTLSTCSNQESDTRLVVNAKLVSSTPYKAIAE